jgi:transcriptional regulator with XRE-family HTH domain
MELRLAEAMPATTRIQARVASILGISSSSVSRRLSGKVAWRVDELDKLARALRVSLSDLMADAVVGAGSSPRQREGSTPFHRQDGRKQKGTGRALGPRAGKSTADDLNGKRRKKAAS